MHMGVVPGWFRGDTVAVPWEQGVSNTGWQGWASGAFCALDELRRNGHWRELWLGRWRRRVRLYYWKQWKRAGARRRNLIRPGIHPAEVYKATRSHRGYWWMAGTSLVQRALDNC